jgi:multicomponent Na+:H+ antiporter subunit B
MPLEKKHGDVLENHILSISLSILTPLILMFGLYIHLHGGVSPGGAFQSGIIFSIPFMSYMLLYGKKSSQGRLFLNSKLFPIIGCIGVLIYAGTGILSDIMGGYIFEYSKLSTNAHSGFHIGIFMIETGVGLAVFGSMCTVFAAFYNFATQD